MSENKMKEPVKIGVLINNDVVPLWVYKVIEKIIGINIMAIKLAIYCRIENDDYNMRESFVYKIHDQLDKFIFRKRIDYQKKTSISGLLFGIKKITISSLNNIYSTENGFDEISNLELDLILNFTSTTIKTNGLKLAKHGIWYFGIEHYSDNKTIANGYWEMIKKIPAIKIVLKSTMNTNERDIVLFRSWIPTNFNSIHLNADHAYGLASLIIPRLLKGFSQYGDAYLSRLILKHEKTVDDYQNVAIRPPTSIQAIVNMALVLYRFFYSRLVYKNSWKWFVLFKFAKNPFPIVTKTLRMLEPPKDRFWADPFVIRKNEKVFIFVEEFIYRLNKGHIALLELDKTGNLLQAKKIIEKPYHMSYPFIFEHQNNYYMIPETYMNKTIALYKCEKFPENWSLVMNLMENIKAMDSTILFYNDKWWLFTAINESSNFPDYMELFLYYSDDIFSTDWKPHPDNPIVSDIRNARPAGKIFIYDKKIYRPSQDCSGRYGRAFNLNQIVTLTETTYEEVFISRTEPDWEPTLKGTHTFNFDKDVIVLDAYTYLKRINL
jgi:hypothetical protein